MEWWLQQFIRNFKIMPLYSIYLISKIFYLLLFVENPTYYFCAFKLKRIIICFTKTLIGIASKFYLIVSIYMNMTSHFLKCVCLYSIMTCFKKKHIYNSSNKERYITNVYQVGVYSNLQSAKAFMKLCRYT